jgi:hypothetical protein
MMGSSSRSQLDSRKPPLLDSQSWCRVTAVHLLNALAGPGSSQQASRWRRRCREWEVVLLGVVRV